MNSKTKNVFSKQICSIGGMVKEATPLVLASRYWFGTSTNRGIYSSDNIPIKLIMLDRKKISEVCKKSWFPDIIT